MIRVAAPLATLTPSGAQATIIRAESTWLSDDHDNLSGVMIMTLRVSSTLSDCDREAVGRHRGGSRPGPPGRLRLRGGDRLRGNRD